MVTKRHKSRDGIACRFRLLSSLPPLSGGNLNPALGMWGAPKVGAFGGHTMETG